MKVSQETAATQEVPTPVLFQEETKRESVKRDEEDTLQSLRQTTLPLAMPQHSLRGKRREVFSKQEQRKDKQATTRIKNQPHVVS